VNLWDEKVGGGGAPRLVDQVGESYKTAEGGAIGGGAAGRKDMSYNRGGDLCKVHKTRLVKT